MKREGWIKVLFVVILLFFAGLFYAFSQIEVDNKSSFSFLKIEGNQIKSTHSLKYSLEIPDGFVQISPMNHSAVFNNHPFDVSFAAFYNGEILVVIHAEKVTDESGFLDYSYMTPVKLNGLDFFMQEHCLEINETLFKEAKDLNHIKNNGFNFGSAIYLRQFFVNSEDGNSELVITFGKKIDDCSEVTNNTEFMKTFNEALTKYVKLIQN